jgi:hypothetical protein
MVPVAAFTAARGLVKKHHVTTIGEAIQEVLLAWAHYGHAAPPVLEDEVPLEDLPYETLKQIQAFSALLPQYIGEDVLSCSISMTPTRLRLKQRTDVCDYTFNWHQTLCFCTRHAETAGYVIDTEPGGSSLILRLP